MSTEQSHACHDRSLNHKQSSHPSIEQCHERARAGGEDDQDENATLAEFASNKNRGSGNENVAWYYEVR